MCVLCNSKMRISYFFFSFLLGGSLFGVNINKYSNTLTLSWDSNPDKFYSVFHSETVDGFYVPIEAAYKKRSLSDFNYNFSRNNGFFKIVESDIGTFLGDIWEALNFGDPENMIPGSRVRSNRSLHNGTFTLDAGYQDLVLINESKAFIINNEGDFEIGNYTITDVDALSGTFNFFNRKAFYKPGARIEFPADLSDPLVFDESSPLSISRSYPDPNPGFTHWTINEDLYFNYPSTLMADDLINKTFKVYAFGDSTDFASYVELNFNTGVAGTILLASGTTDISYTFEKLTHSVANLSFSFIPQIPNAEASLGQIGSVNVDVSFFSYDVYSGYFYGAIESEGSSNEIYGYYGEESIPVEHLYGYPLNQIVILYDQNNDGFITQEDAEIFIANNPGILWLYPSLGSIPTISELAEASSSGSSTGSVEVVVDEVLVDVEIEAAVITEGASPGSSSGAVEAAVDDAAVVAEIEVSEVVQASSSGSSSGAVEAAVDDAADTSDTSDDTTDEDTTLVIPAP